MSHSIHHADRATHRKIVIVALLAAISVTAFTLCVHVYAKPATIEAALGRPHIAGSAVLAASR
ncbi:MULTISPECIES: hypothetical protein [Bradyrhizobium]|uniref:hypothetical protein n=1 Tax=Bradyrhizobium TaxID=374 RepID=UPI001B8A3611|nr:MULTISPECIES: hypothetical protein [Bradyrhizobium]MBR0973002.1 hypothetical protein [Bradyrhizobium japonicum]